MTAPARGHDGTLGGDAAWSYAAFGVFAATGAASNLAIAFFLGEAAMGVFAQLYALFVVLGQLASFGVHDSAQRGVALARAARRDDRPVASSAILAVLGPAVLVALALAALAAPLGAFLESPEVVGGVLRLAPGIGLFALNKCLLAVLTGRGEIRRVALGQMLRAAGFGGALALVIALALPVETLGGVFTMSELALTWRVVSWVAPSRLPRGEQAAIGAHLRFGLRGLLHAVLLETQLRVDVLMLAVFAGDHEVGVYAFAALFGEGLYQVGGVLRGVVYARVVAALALGDRSALHALVRKTAALSFGAAAVVGLGVVLLFPAIAAAARPAFAEGGIPIVRILVVTMVLYALVAPFDQILLQSGRPGAQSAWMAFAVGTNVIANLVLIPRLGGQGAALATALAFLVASLTLMVLARAMIDPARPAPG
jgi:O-antigen/teichoic acid export membrane protein